MNVLWKGKHKLVYNYFTAVFTTYLTLIVGNKNLNYCIEFVIRGI